MTIQVNGVHMNVGENLTAEVVEKIEAVSDKYYGKMISATVNFVKEANGLVECKIHLHPAGGKEFFSTDESENAKESFAGALLAMNGQLQKDHAKNSKIH